jgi:cell division protein FtsQ
VVRRPHLSIVPAHGLGGRLRAPSARAVTIAASIVAGLGLLYLGARETPVFALGELEVTGASPAVRRSVEAAAKPYVGESLVALDQDELRRQLESLSTVRSVRLDRAFPHTLRIAVVAERPLAVVRRGPDAWLVSEHGRVIRELDRGRRSTRTNVWTGPDTSLVVGGTVADAELRAVLDALRRVPDSFPARVSMARVEEGEVTLVLASGAELRLGERTSLPLKLAVAARVLGTMTAEERGELGYLDVTVPALPVGGDKSQLSS